MKRGESSYSRRLGIVIDSTQGAEKLHFSVKGGLFKPDYAGGQPIEHETAATIEESGLGVKDIERHKQSRKKEILAAYVSGLITKSRADVLIEGPRSERVEEAVFAALELSGNVPTMKQINARAQRWTKQGKSWHDERGKIEQEAIKEDVLVRSLVKTEVEVARQTYDVLRETPGGTSYLLAITAGAMTPQRKKERYYEHQPLPVFRALEVMLNESLIDIDTFSTAQKVLRVMVAEQEGSFEQEPRFLAQY